MPALLAARVTMPASSWASARAIDPRCRGAIEDLIAWRVVGLVQAGADPRGTGNRTREVLASCGAGLFLREVSGNVPAERA